MNKRRSNMEASGDLRARVAKFLAAPGPDLGQMPWEGLRKLVQELQDRQFDLERQNEDLRRSQAALATGPDRHDTLYDLTPVACFTLDPQGIIVAVNAAAARLLGKERDSLLHTPFSRFVAPGNHEDLQAHLRSEPAGGVSQSCDLLLRPCQGPPFSASLQSLTVVDAGGAVLQYHTVVRDITKRKQAEENLRKSEALYRLIVETANEGIWGIDSDFRTTYVNPVMAAMLGCRTEDMFNRPLSDFIFSEDLADYEDKTAQIRQGQDDVFEHRLRRHGGSEMWCMISARSLSDEQGQFQGAFAMFADITQRKQAEEALRLAAHQWQATFDAINDGICLLDLNCRILGCNQAMATLLGQPADEILGSHCYEIIHGTTRPIPDCPLVAMLQSRQRQELVLPHEDRWFRAVVDPILDETGIPLGAVHRITDITHLIKSEAALKLSLQESRQGQKEVKALLDASRAVLAQDSFADVARSIFAASQTVMGAAQGFVSLLSEDGPEPTWLFLHDGGLPGSVEPELPESLSRLRAKAHRLGQPVFDNKFSPNGWMACLPGGNGSFTNVLLAPLMENGRVVGLLGFANKPEGFSDHDVSLATGFAKFATIALRQKRAEEALRESEAHFRQLFESSADAIFLYDQGKIIQVNEQACRSLGYSREDLLRLKVMDIEAEVDWQEIQKNQAPDSLKNTFIGKHRRQDGSTFPVEVRSSNFPAQGRNLRLAAVRDITAQRQAELATRESEQLYRSLFENMLNGFAYCKMLFEPDQSPDFIYLEVNNSFATLTGLKNVVGKKVSEVIPGLRESDPELLEIYGRVALTGKPEKFEKYIIATKMWLSISVYSPAKGYFVAIFDVITERKQAEEALRHSRETLRVLLDATPAGVCLLNPQGLILAANRVLAQRLETPIKELVGTCLFDYLSSDLIETRQARMEQIKCCRQPLRFEDNHDGLIFDTYVHPILSVTGELAGLAVLSVDITARKQAEEALAQQSRFLQLLIDTIPTPVFYKDAEGCYLGCNRAFQDFYGLSMDQIVGNPVDCLGPKDAVEKYRQMDLKLFRHPGIQSYEHAVLRADGRKRELAINKATFPQANGAVGGLVGVMSDITDLKQAQQQLRALAARLAEVEETDRQHLARELHDEVGQGLTALGLNLTLLMTQMSKQAAEPLLTRLADAVALVEKIGETIRNVMAELRPPVLDDYGLLSALRWYSGEFSRQTGIGVQVQGEEATPRLARPVELALFRIAQEALTNIAKHAEASEVALSEVLESDTVRLIIADNGIGFDRARVGQPEGRYRWGLMNMSERAAAAGGSCRIESRPGHGTRVVVEVSR